MVRFLSLALLAGLAASGFARSTKAADCEALYLAREESLETAEAAAECYLAEALDDTTAERASLAMSWVVRKTPDRARQAQWIERGLRAAEAWIASELASGPYWRSVFVTFRANFEDEGRVIPRALIGALPAIREDLRIAAARRPETHAFGPDRVQGIILLEAHVLVGGDPKKAAEAFERASAGAPRSILNRFWLAKAWIRIRKKEAAKALLEEIVAIDASAIDPAERPEELEAQTEAAKVLGALR